MNKCFASQEFLFLRIFVRSMFGVLPPMFPNKMVQWRKCLGNCIKEIFAPIVYKIRWKTKIMLVMELV